jgi:hypothetical protein
MKPYSTQYKQCKKNKTIVEIPCQRCGHINLVCKKNVVRCSSIVCRAERESDTADGSD